MSTSDFGPYRATALWNEAVITFRDGIQLTEHRHLFHKHKNCFTGSEAVRFLHGCLRSNGLFNPNITREQTKQLLNQFLNAELIRRVKDCSSASEGRFRDSSKYIYEFTDKLRTFKGNLPLTSFSNRLRSLNPEVKPASEQPVKNCSNDDNEWKHQVLMSFPDRIFEAGTNRLTLDDSPLSSVTIPCSSNDSNKSPSCSKFLIKDFLNPLDVSALIPTDKIESKWVVTNASPEWVKIKWNTELPHWILSAIHNLINCALKSNCQDMYPEFELELFKIISGYFATLRSPLISRYLYDLIVNVYLYFDSLNNLIVDKAHTKITASQENLLDCISSPTKKTKTKVREMTKLVSNSCLETAFTSDDPIIRIVPQRSYDIVHLKRNASFSSKSHTYNLEQPRVQTLKSRENERRPLQEVKFLPSDNQLHFKTVSRSCYDGIDNAAFSFFSPKSVAEKIPQATFPFDCLRSSPERGRYMRSKSSDNLDNIHVYVNHGLNYSVDDCDGTLDYKYAMESVDKLLKASQSKKSVSSEDLTGSFYTASSSSSPDICGANSYENIDLEELALIVESKKKEWQRPITRMCTSVYQLILLLIPPNNRAQLKHLMRILHVVPRSSRFQQLSFSQMVSQLQDVILSPQSSSKGLCDQNILLSIIQFLATYYEDIFSELPTHIVSEIENEFSQAKRKENVFCEQISGRTFEEQKVASSRSALDELLCQILNNKSLSAKEKKKHLKMFKQYYPEIYYTRIDTNEKSSKKKSTKNFRV